MNSKERQARYLKGDLHNQAKVSNSYAAALASRRIKNPEVLNAFLNPPRTEESGTWMEALHGRIPPHHVEAVDIPNDGHIPNLPKGSIIEVPGVIDPSGVRGFAVGELLPRWPACV